LRDFDVGPAFIHLWSLADEEQFYLIWPLLIYLLPSTTIRAIVLCIILLTPFLRLGLYLVLETSGYDPIFIGRAIYSLPITQFDAFAFGAAIPLWKLQELKNAARLFMIASILAAILGLAVILHDHILYRSAFKASLGYPMFLLPLGGFVWGYTLLDLISAGAIICAIQRLWVMRIVETSALVRVGQISYGVYVYHVPLLLGIRWLANGTIPGFVLFGIYAGAVLLISELSFRWLETPFLLRKNIWFSGAHKRPKLPIPTT
jgi:peptidoglycan/LPS O-acetylase OafA/YrhL